MDFRFRRSIKVFPGVRLNISKSGVSTSVGRPGLNVTLGHGRTRTTVGAPGTGLSYTSTSKGRIGVVGWILAAVVLLIVFALLSGCSAHSPFIVANTTQATPAAKTLPAHSDRVFVTQHGLPPAVRFEVISQIDVGTVWYGAAGDVLTSMANRARELGANAIINARTWHQPSGLSWAAPHGSGQAIRVDDVTALQGHGILGSWY